ncbi:hypothetical protein ACFLZZ_00420 [Nanoarchaeota archaeon]
MPLEDKICLWKSVYTREKGFRSDNPNLRCVTCNGYEFFCTDYISVNGEKKEK